VIIAHLAVLIAAMTGLACASHFAVSGAPRTRMLAGAAAVGIAAVSQQFLVMVGAGVLLILMGLARQKAKHPAQKKLGKMNIVAGLVMIGIAVYMFYLR